MTAERRSWRRAGLGREIGATLLDPAGLAVRDIAVRVDQICLGGATLALAEPLWPGCAVRLALRHPSPSTELDLLAAVVHVGRHPADGHLAGVRFTALGDAERVALVRLVRSLAHPSGTGSPAVAGA